MLTAAVHQLLSREGAFSAGHDQRSCFGDHASRIEDGKATYLARDEYTRFLAPTFKRRSHGSRLLSADEVVGAMTR